MESKFEMYSFLFQINTMKSQTTKRLFAFIIVMLSLSLTQFAFAQKCNPSYPCPAGYNCAGGKCKPATYYCQCASRGWGCGGDAACVYYCSYYCGSVLEKPVPINDTSFANISSNHVSQFTTISFILPQSEKNSIKLFDVTAGSLK